MQKKKKKFNFVKGFTLIELLATILIIALLGGIGVVGYKRYFDVGKRPTNIFISNNIKIVSKDNEIKSDFGYFDIQNNLLLLYNNVNIFSKTNTSSGEFYIYNFLDKSIVSFTENTILPKRQQDNIYKILEKISEELNLQHKSYILNFVKNNKIYNNIDALHNYGVNYNIDRQKRTKIEVMY